MQRLFCPRCGIKHLSQAAILIKETQLGYPLHIYYALGHMAEASDEIVERMPEEANEVRKERLKLEDALRTETCYIPDFPRLLKLVSEGALLEETQTEESPYATRT